jgi:hypothetical protein
MLVSAANNKGKQLLRTTRILMMGIERTSSRPPDNITLIITQKVLESRPVSRQRSYLSRDRAPFANMEIHISLLT